jgi:hypothetical protein
MRRGAFHVARDRLFILRYAARLNSPCLLHTIETTIKIRFALSSGLAIGNRPQLQLCWVRPVGPSAKKFSGRESVPFETGSPNP